MIDEIDILRERIDDLSEELAYYKGKERYVCVHNQLNSFDNPLKYIPVSSVGDNELRQTIVEIQTGNEELNMKLAEFICVCLNKGVF